MAQSGYIYILSNASTNGVVKIGKTRQDPNERAKELSSASGVPTPFVVIYQAYFTNCNEAESFVHSRLEKFRIANNREFFRVPIPLAIDTVIEAKNAFATCEGSLSDIDNADSNNSEEFDTITFGTIQEPEKELFELLDVLMNHSMRGWHNFVKSTGLSMPQFSILMQLHYRGVFSISEISDRFGISVAAASQLVHKLVEAGYLERAEDPNDRRAKLLPLSNKGKRLIEHGYKKRYQWFDKIITKMGAAERLKVTEALTILTESVQRLEEKQ